MRRMQRSFELRMMELRERESVSVISRREREWKSHEPVLLNASCLTGAGTPMYSVQSHCQGGRISAATLRRRELAHLLRVDVPDVNVSSRGPDVDQVASRVEASKGGHLAAVSTNQLSART